MSVLLLLLGLLAVVVSNPPLPLPHPHLPPPPPPPHCLEYGGCRRHHHAPFVPAPPGKTPSCAKHGETFCEKIDRYPTHLIRYLIDHWVYDYRTLLSDESRSDPPNMKKTVKPSYGPPPQQPPYGGFPYPPAIYPPSHPLGGNSVNYTQEGYPDRHYPLSSLPLFNNDPDLAYSGLLTPDVTPYDPSHWWKRYSRSDEGQTRSKRQLPGQDTQLCPTRSQFVSPKAALNGQGNWMFIVNLDQDQNRFTQQVRAEVCISNQCQGICTLPNGYTSRCQQQYVQKRLIALEGSGNQLYTDTFWLPHCCICQITPSNNG
ncbi:protein spaetzle 5 [Macrosteles quadrilineatus]|uniref:protein spaetzle 5 n=1 Tax=Macrosteles quadrilineatus TaxID=74068 RepID=UPI0023E105E9|nr:protein spaetzle 5 [Macrosteles quadrilineatus]